MRFFYKITLISVGKIDTLKIIIKNIFDLH